MLRRSAFAFGVWVAGLVAPASGQVVTTMSAVKAAVVVGEPVILRMHVENHGTGPVQMPRDLRASTGGGVYFIKRENDEFRRIQPISVRESEAVELAPGEVVVHEEAFGIDAGAKEPTLLFDSPGQYQLKARVWIDGVAIETEPVAVAVSLPADEASLAVLETVTTPIVLNALATGLASADVRPTLEPIAQGQSVYAPYAAIAIASYYLHQSEYGMAVDTAAEHLASRTANALEWAEIANQDGTYAQAQALELKWAAYRLRHSHSRAEVVRQELLAKHPASAAAARVR